LLVNGADPVEGSVKGTTASDVGGVGELDPEKGASDRRIWRLVR
jgi:hypothetical protein